MLSFVNFNLHGLSVPSRVESIRFSRYVFPFLAQPGEEGVKFRRGTQTLQMRIPFEEGETRESIGSRILDPLLRLLELTQQAIDGTDRIGSVMEMAEAFADAYRFSNIGLGAAPVACFSSQHCARTMQYATRIVRLFTQCGL